MGEGGRCSGLVGEGGRCSGLVGEGGRCSGLVGEGGRCSGLVCEGVRCSGLMGWVVYEMMIAGSFFFGKIATCIYYRSFMSVYLLPSRFRSLDNICIVFTHMYITVRCFYTVYQQKKPTLAGQ